MDDGTKGGMDVGLGQELPEFTSFTAVFSVEKVWAAGVQCNMCHEESFLLLRFLLFSLLTLGTMLCM